MVTKQIPRITPTREEVAEVGRHNVIVATALKFFRHDLADYETALRIAVVALAEQNDKLIEQATQAAPPAISIDVTEQQLRELQRRADDDEQLAELRADREESVYLLDLPELSPLRAFVGGLAAGGIAIFFLCRWALQ